MYFVTQRKLIKAHLQIPLNFEYMLTIDSLSFVYKDFLSVFEQKF